jgi:glycosyltransferase involved in cell wall biosynthesis
MVILEYHPITGGAQQQLAALAPLLRRRGIEVEILTRRVPGRPKAEVIDGVRVERLAAPGPKAIASLVFTVSALMRLYRRPPDVVHAYSLFSPTTVATLAHRLLSLPTVVKVLRGGIAGDAERLRRKPLAQRRIRALQHHVDRVVAISNEIREELSALGIPAERVVAIPNGVDIEHFRPLAGSDRARLRASLGWTEAPTGVFCGRLVPEKRIELLLEAWAKLRLRHPEAQLSIVGTGPCEAALRKLPHEGVRFEGAVEDVAPYLQAADCFVLPSDAEGLSNAMLEAMSAGLPVVATRVGGAPDLVAEACTGRTVAPGDADALAEALLSVLEDPARARLGARGRERVAQGYCLAATADRLAALYRELAPHDATEVPS